MSALALSGLLASAVASPVATDAAWVDRETATAAALTAGSVAPPTGFRCTDSGLLDAVTFSWTNPSGGLTRTEYRWAVTGTSSTSGALPANATSIRLTTGILGFGSWTFTLRAVGPGGWQSAPVTGRLSFTTGLLSACSVP